MEIDRKTGKTLRHWEKKEKKEGADRIAEALGEIKNNREKLDKYFSGAGQSLKARKKELSAIFDKEKKRIIDSGDTSRPLNPMDLD